MFLTIAKINIQRNKVYSPVIITNENGKGKPFFSYSMILSSTALFNDENCATSATH